MQHKIKGGSLPVVEVHLNAGESIRCQNGGMVWMSDNMQMSTQGGGIGKMIGRAMSGEAMFQNVYTAKGGPGMIAFGGCFPGSIMAVNLQGGQELICQKTAYLASTMGIELSIAFQKKLGAGLFGGEGFIMQRISGNGVVFLEIDGAAISYKLAAGERMVIDTGHLAIMDGSCTMSIKKVPGGAKNILLGGEGLFNTVVTGPGRIMLQTMPKSALASLFSSVSN